MAKATPFLDEPEEQHESFGVAGFYHRSGGNFNLFGSSIRHNNTIALVIKRATRRRYLSNNNWIHGREQLIEVVFSPNQFANLLTSMNVGDGVPCTIEYVGAKRMADCPSHEQRAVFEQEFEEDVHEVMSKAGDIVKEVKTLFDTKSNITKADRTEIVKKLEMLMQTINSNLPFVQSQFNEAMDKTVTEARAEVEAFVDSKIRSLGIQALESEVQKALAATKESPVLRIESKVVK